MIMSRSYIHAKSGIVWIDLSKQKLSLGARPNSDGEIVTAQDSDNAYNTFQQFHRNALTEEQKDNL